MYTAKEVQFLAPWYRDDLKDLPSEKKLRYLKKRKVIVKAIRELEPGEFVEVLGHVKATRIKEAYWWVYPEDEIEVYKVRHGDDQEEAWIFSRKATA